MGKCKPPSEAAIARMLVGSSRREDLEAYAVDNEDALLEDESLFPACDIDMDDDLLAEALAAGDITLVHGRNGAGEVELLVETPNMRRFKELEAEYLKLSGSLSAEGEGISAGFSDVAKPALAGSVEAGFNAVKGLVGDSAAEGINVDAGCSLVGPSKDVNLLDSGSVQAPCADSMVVDGLEQNLSFVPPEAAFNESSGVCGGHKKDGIGGLKSGFLPSVCPTSVQVGNNGMKGKSVCGGSAPFVEVGRQGLPNKKKGKKVGWKSMNEGVGEKLSFMPPVKNRVVIDVADVLPLEEVWGCVLLGQYVGAPLPDFKIAELMRSVWKVNVNFRHEGGWLIFQFSSVEARDEVLRNGPYLVYGKPLIVKLVPEYFSFDKREVSTVPLWVRLMGVSKQLWTKKNLSSIASHVGVPLYMDPVTTGKKRGAFARVLVEVNLAKEIQKEVEVDIVDKGSVYNLVCHFEIENMPIFCRGCYQYGHSFEGCSVSSKKSHGDGSGEDDPAGTSAGKYGGVGGWDKGPGPQSYAQVVNSKGWANWAGKDGGAKHVSSPQSESQGCASGSKRAGAALQARGTRLASSSGALSGGPEGAAAAGCSVVKGSFGVLASEPKLCADDESAVLRARKQRLMEEGLLEDCGGETDSMCSEDFGDYAMGGDFVEDLMEDICSPEFVDDEGFEMVRSRSQRKKSKANEGREIVLGMKAKPKWPGDPCVPSSGSRPGKASRRIP